MPERPHLTDAKQKLLERMRRGGLKQVSAAADDLKGLSRDIPAPLALAQERVWRLDQTAGKLAPLHNESITIHRRGPFDRNALERSIAEIVRRHEIWRTTFRVESGRPVQIIHPAPKTYTLPFDDLRALPEDQRNKRAIDLATHDASKAFDLERGPLFRIRMITLSDDEHRLYLTAHQSIVDGITVFDVFPSELTTLYESFCLGKASPLPELTTQYADFSNWQHRNLSGDVMETQVKYWQKLLAGDLPPLQWPNPAMRPACQTYRGAMHSFTLPAELSQSLKEVGRGEGATLFMVLLASLVKLLHRYTGQEDIIVGTLAPSGRKRSEFQHLLGYFINPVALRANLSGNPPFVSLLHQMRNVTLGAISHDDVPLEVIVEKLPARSDPSRHPVFTVALSVTPDVPPLPGGWSMTYMDVESGGARWDLYLEMSDRTEGLLGRAQYNPDLFTPAAISQTVEDFRVTLEQIASSRDSHS